MFVTNLKPGDLEYRQTVLRHIKELQKLGYTGFEFPIAPNEYKNYGKDIEDYASLRCSMDSEGLADIKITTNVGATSTFDPSSPTLNKDKQH